MAKAQFHKSQRVYVKPVGTWAIIEQVIPKWAKGLDEPLRVFYDVGMGREFGAEELQAEGHGTTPVESTGQNWRVVRTKNKYQTSEECAGHPYPGSYPTIVTGEKDWGGWRVPGAEYDLDPHKIEMQGRIIANALRMLGLVQQVVEISDDQAENLPVALLNVAKDGEQIIRAIMQTPVPDEEVEGEAKEAASDASAA